MKPATFIILGVLLTVLITVEAQPEGGKGCLKSGLTVSGILIKSFTIDFKQFRKLITTQNRSFLSAIIYDVPLKSPRTS